MSRNEQGRQTERLIGKCDSCVCEARDQKKLGGRVVMLQSDAMSVRKRTLRVVRKLELEEPRIRPPGGSAVEAKRGEEDG